MKQQRLKFTGGESPIARLDMWDKRNLETAKEILAKPEAHGGETAFPCRWARLVIERLEGAAA